MGPTLITEDDRVTPQLFERGSATSAGPSPTFLAVRLPVTEKFADLVGASLLEISCLHQVSDFMYLIGRRRSRGVQSLRRHSWPFDCPLQKSSPI